MMDRYHHLTRLNEVLDREYYGQEGNPRVISMHAFREFKQTERTFHDKREWFEKAGTLFLIATWAGIWVSVVLFFPI